MNDLITTKLNEGWKLVGGVSVCVGPGGELIKICQAMTLEITNQKSLIKMGEW